MARKSREDLAIRDFILRNIGEHSNSIVSEAMKKFDYSRPGILRYIHKLSAEGLMSGTGNTYARRYSLKPLVTKPFKRAVDFLWSEDDAWRKDIHPLMAGMKQNVIDICQYGFTEMINNVIDHSSSPDVFYAYRQNYAEIHMMIQDTGVGIFEKIQKDFKLADPRTALLELSKGRITSDRKRHSGEGIYFTSRMFDKFFIRSGNLFYSREKRDGDDWLIENNDRTAYRKGTLIGMFLRTDAEWTKKEVFETYLGDALRFRKTHVPLKLAQYPGEELVSRSQAKRLLTRLDNFSEVFLDFQGVEQIGQPFADEIFRVFKNDHPDTEISIIRANDYILKIINFVITEGKGEKP